MKKNVDTEMLNGDVEEEIVPVKFLGYSHFKNDDVTSYEELDSLEYQSSETIKDQELKMNKLKEEMDALKKKLEQCDLQSKAYDILQNDYMKLKKMCNEAQTKYDNMEAELRRMCYRAQEAEVFRIERDLFKEKLKHVHSICIENSILKKKTSNLQLMLEELEEIRARYEQRLQQLQEENSLLRKSLTCLQCQTCPNSDVGRLIKDLHKKENVIRSLTKQMKQNILAYNSRQDEYQYNLEILESSVNYLNKALQEETNLNMNLKTIIQNQDAQSNYCFYSQSSMQLQTKTYDANPI